MAEMEGGGSNASSPTTNLHVLGHAGNNRGGNATLSQHTPTNFGSATQHAQQNPGSGANNLDGGPQNPPPAQTPLNPVSTVPIPNASPALGAGLGEHDMHGMPVPLTQATQSSLAHSSERCAILLNSNQDVMSEQCTRAMSEFNADFDMQSQPSNIQDTIRELMHGEHGHWFKTYLPNLRESQHVQMADFIAFLNNTCDGGILDEDLKCVLVHERHVMITSPKFFLKYALPSLVMSTILRQLLELSSDTPHEGLESDLLFEIIATHCATTFQGRSGSTALAPESNRLLGTTPTKPARWSGIEEVNIEQTFSSAQAALQIDVLTPLTNTPVAERLTDAKARREETIGELKHCFNVTEGDIISNTTPLFETPEVQSLRETRIHNFLEILYQSVEKKCIELDRAQASAIITSTRLQDLRIQISKKRSHHFNMVKKELQDRINTLEHVKKVSTRDAMAQQKRALQSAFSQHAEQLQLVQETALKNITEILGGNNNSPPDTVKWRKNYLSLGKTKKTWLITWRPLKMKMTN
jgi:hypothetical protein